MTSRRSPTRSMPRMALFGAAALALCLPAWGQAAPAPESAPKKDDTPSVKVGGTLFADYTYYTAPEKSNGAGTYNLSSFNVTRAYINIIGNVSHLISFRFTPDIAQETKAVGADGKPADINGSYVYRIKFAYGQLNLDDWLPKGSWLRLGAQPTPYPGWMDDIYRYRFQGGAFTDREKLLTTSDTGIAAQFAFAKDYGEVHAGFYNGETYTGAEKNNQKSFQVRVAVRPVPAAPVLKGLRFAFFADIDKYQNDAPRRRYVEAVTFEHPRVNAGAEYVGAFDQDPARKFPVSYPAEVEAIASKGWSAWVTPKLPKRFELVLRYGWYTADDTLKDPSKTRVVGGVAYWFPVQKGVTTALLLDYEQVTYKDFTGTQPDDEKKWAIHSQVTF